MRGLSILGGISAPLILTASASAGFTGLYLSQKKAAQVADLYVCNVYAAFDRPDDEMVAVAGDTQNTELLIEVQNGVFYQDDQGSALTAPLNILLPGASGLLAYDTFLTIGVKVDDFFTASDDVSTTPGLAFEPDRLQTNNGSWFILPSGVGQGGNGAPDKNGRVLIFQGSVFKNPDPTLYVGINGTMLIQFTSNGVPGQQQVVSFSHVVPTPGALALLAAAGLGVRRRRRS